ANAVIAYLAAIKYADAEVGRIITELASHPEIYNNTIIVIIGDNGFSLGEKMHWRKSTLWEPDSRVPMIIADLRNIQPQVCNRTVSLLDIYPTLVDILDLDPPVFTDGSPYLDGKSLAPLLQNPNLPWEKPSLVTYKDSYGEEGSCFPLYGVRNERFHYINYHSNNIENVVECDSSLSIEEEELYDIGVNRQTDPNEWNNLIDDDDYAPVVNYLKEYLPGGDRYMQKAFSVNINHKPFPCFLNAHTSFKLNTSLFNSEGALINGAAIANYQFKWTNNLTGAIFFGKSYTFNTATIPPTIFSSSDHLMFYLEVTELATGKLVAFNTINIYINNANTPSSTFSLVSDVGTLSTDISSYIISGSYLNTYWEFGDGTSSEEFWPDMHYYSSPGAYTVRNYIQYGNGCTKTTAHIAYLLREGITDINYRIYPNPANTIINIQMQNDIGEIQIQVINTLGEIVYANALPNTENIISINIENFAAGTYILRLSSANGLQHSLFEVIH
ncbi:MAG: sulfatase-like hydrolase/transferase, partial [Chitinophagales bacterium]